MLSGFSGTIRSRLAVVFLAAEPAIKAVCRHGRDGACGFALRFRKVITDETEEWAKVVKFSGAKPG